MRATGLKWTVANDGGAGDTFPAGGAMMTLRRYCVFCGSSAGRRPLYADAARALGAEFVRRGIGLVYGGGKVGLMGVLADAVLAEGGRVIGVIPHRLRTVELAHEGLTELRVVDSMHARKALMADLSDGFIALPGGLGTFEELLEIATWGQLRLHAKPVGLLNVAGFFDPLLATLDHSVAEGFLRAEHRALLIVRGEIDALLETMAGFRPARDEESPDRDLR